MTMSPLVLDRSGAVATITLNRPDAGNAIDLALAQALLDAALECDADDGIRCVVLTGSGRLFCAGGDVKAFGSAGREVPSLIKKLTASLHMAIARFAHMPKPLITAINGPAAGAGVGLAIMGDVAIAARSAHFTLAYGALGLSPDAGATWLLPRLIGLRRAQQMALAGERIDATEAARIGLVTQAVDDQELLGAAQTMADRLAQGAVRAIGRTRELLLGSFDVGLETHLEREAQMIAALSATFEGQEGISAFSSKRKADFAGSRGE